MCCSPPTPVTLPFPLGSLPNPLLPRVTSLGPGTRCFIFNSPPLPLGELPERREGRPLGCSLLLCPSAQPVSLMLRLASLLGVSLFPACPPSPSWPVFCLGALVSIPSFRVFHLLSGLPSPFCLISFQLLLLPPLLPLFSPGPLLLSSLLPRPPTFPLPSRPLSPCSPTALVPWWPLTRWPGPPSVHVPSGSDRELGWGEAVVAEILEWRGSGSETLQST